MKDFIVSNIDWIIPLVYAIGSTIVGVISSIKQKNKSKATETLKSSIIQFISDAEAFKHYSGEEKKMFVMTRALSIANDLMSEEEISTFIENEIALTNNVNIFKKKVN